MTWRPEDPQGNEAGKIRFEIVPYTLGVGLDLGCGPFKAFPHFIGVDNSHHAKMFGWPGRPDVHVDDAAELKPFASGSLDFVFSSHLLEHIQDTDKALREWWRVLRPDGCLVLYLPHKDLYPNIGQPGANPDHKHDFLPEDIVKAMKAIGSWDLAVNETRGGGQEYSFLQVYRKKLSGKSTYSHEAPRPEKKACIVRYGGIGDMLQAATVAPGLKAQGYHVTFMTTPHGRELLEKNPHIDDFLVQGKDQVPNEELGHFWSTWSPKFDRFINLSETIEGDLLALPGRVKHDWPLVARQKILGTVSYYERTADLAGVPYRFAPSFFPSGDEIAWSNKQRASIPGQHIVMLALGGSSVHKRYPYWDLVALDLLANPDVTLLTTGDAECQLLEEALIQGVLKALGAPEDLINQAVTADGVAGLQELVRQRYGRHRIICQSGKWSVRQTLAFLDQCAAVVGPETGILNAAAFMDIRKVVLLSHSSGDNLCKHWTYTTTLQASVPCHPCHRMHYDFTHCVEHETGASACMGTISPHLVAQATLDSLPKIILTGTQ